MADEFLVRYATEYFASESLVLGYFEEDKLRAATELDAQDGDLRAISHSASNQNTTRERPAVEKGFARRPASSCVSAPHYSLQEDEKYRVSLRTDIRSPLHKLVAFTRSGSCGERQ
jgi:hypothetical protein